MSDLPHDLHALTDGQPAVADWPGLVRRTARRRAHRRHVTAALGVVVLLVLGGGAVTAFASTHGSHDVQSLDGPTDTPNSTPQDHASVTDLVKVPAPTCCYLPDDPASPSPQPVPSEAAPSTLEDTTSPTTSPTPRTVEQTIVIDSVHDAPTTVAAGDAATFRWHGRWSAERPQPMLGCDDCGRDTPVYPGVACSGPEDGHPAESGEDDFTAQLTLHHAGTFHVELLLTSGCGNYYRGSASRVVTITVTGSEPSPSGSPTASGTATP